jgi:hypothetical protein
VDYVWTNATTATPALGTDALLMDRSNTKYKVTADTLKTFVRASIQADTLGAYVHGLSAATLATTDNFVVSQGGTCKSATLSAVETKLWTDYATYVTGLDSATAADADVLYVLQSGVAKKLTLTSLATYVEAEITDAGTLGTAILGGLNTYVEGLTAATTMTATDKLYTVQSGTSKYVTASTLASYAASAAAELPWALVGDSKYTALPASTSTITMTDTSDFAIGYPVKYRDSSGTFYGIVTAVAANSLLTIAGATLDTGRQLLELRVGRPERVVPATFFVDGTYGAAEQDLFAVVTKSRYRWSMANAYLVRFSAAHDTVDTGATQPVVNVKVGGDLVATTGVAMSGVAGTWVNNGAVDISPTHYAVANGDAIDIRCTTAGANGNAEDLTVSMVFVLE